MPTTSAPATFLATLYPDGWDDRLRLVTWTLEDKRSVWNMHTAGALKSIERNASRDTYVSVGLAPSPKVPDLSKVRPKNDDIEYIPALWADIDFKDGVTEVQARAALAALPLPPSMLVHSGHGLQPWWVLLEPLTGADVSAVPGRFGEWLRQHLGFPIDSVFDPARIMRVPGTMNRKDFPVEVLLEHADGPLLPRRELDTLISGIKAPTATNRRRASSATVAAATASGSIVLSADANPPAAKLRKLIKFDPVVDACIDRTHELPDSSPSGYDLSLATRAAQHKWEDQEIVDLCIMARREAGDDPKIDRPDYWARTLANARNSFRVVKGFGDGDSDEPVDIEEAREFIAAALGIDGDIRMKRTLGRPPSTRSTSIATRSSWVRPPTCCQRGRSGLPSST